MTQRVYFSLDGDPSSDYNIYINKPIISILPPLRTVTQEVVGRDGVVDFGIDAYGVRTISETLFCFDKSSVLRSNKNDITAWLSGGYKQLVFSHTPDEFFIAKVSAAINWESNTKEIGTIEFVCNPPFAYKNGLLLTPENILWNTATLDGTQYHEHFEADGYMRFAIQNDVSPIIKLIGQIPIGFQLAYGTQTWKYDADLNYDGVKINCDAESVTLMSDDSNIFSNVDPAHDDYFNLEEGQIQIDITGMSGTGVDIFF